MAFPTDVGRPNRRLKSMLRAAPSNGKVNFTSAPCGRHFKRGRSFKVSAVPPAAMMRSEEHTSELQSRGHLVCRLLLEKKNQCGMNVGLSRGSMPACSQPVFHDSGQIVRL